MIKLKEIKSFLLDPFFWGYIFTGGIFLFLSLFMISIFFSGYDAEYEYYVSQKQDFFQYQKKIYEIENILSEETSFYKDGENEEIGEEKEEVSEISLREYYDIIQEYKTQNSLAEKEKAQSMINMSYSPAGLEQYFKKNAGIEAIYTLLEQDFFQKNIKKINIDIYRQKDGIRGRFKNNIIELYDVHSENENEVFGVFIHELGHYFDIIFLEKKIFGDISNDFYNISWSSLYEIKNGATAKDFVSGYAMTNKYEDFAESFIYYVLFNNDFLIKSIDNPMMKSKYDFFSKNIFKNGEFQNTGFRLDEPKIYYRDITKINFSLKNFLQYLEKGL